MAFLGIVYRRVISMRGRPDGLSSYATSLAPCKRGTAPCEKEAQQSRVMDCGLFVLGILGAEISKLGHSRGKSEITVSKTRSSTV